MRCESGPESPMQRCQMAARDRQKIPQSNLEVNYWGHFLICSKVCCLLRQVMDLRHADLARSTPHHGKKHVFFFPFVSLTVLSHTLCFPCVSPSGSSRSVPFLMGKGVGKDGSPWGYGGAGASPACPRLTGR